MGDCTNLLVCSLSAASVLRFHCMCTVYTIVYGRLSNDSHDEYSDNYDDVTNDNNNDKMKTKW